jgi:hypothetical protein
MEIKTLMQDADTIFPKDHGLVRTRAFFPVVPEELEKYVLSGKRDSSQNSQNVAMCSHM